MTKDADYIRRLEAKIVELTMSNDDLWQENTDLSDELRAAKLTLLNYLSPDDITRQAMIKVRSV